MSFIQHPSSDPATARTQVNCYPSNPPQVNDNLRCCYPSKHCQNLRVVKRNGELHRLCEYHRSKANVNQRRLEQRRRMRNNAVVSTANWLNEDKHLSFQSLSLANLSSTGISELELNVLDDFLSQTDIELSPANGGTTSFFQDFADDTFDKRMPI
ncbi:hypothetical protein PHMEG_00016152 [Phytophthora megakarya]|uniref:Uncharacterized protein n=1 Tax=Phytophthora megakarya TaxID=4795 RepID=A0A225VZI0_9STRA|nr:hypothetical protein PHMEG_00016152 [Phytophthora megakarya]